MTDFVSTKLSDHFRPITEMVTNQPKFQYMEEQKVYLIVQDKAYGKVFARVFGSLESVKKALNERDERTGEKLYPDCHFVERTIE